MIRSIQIESIQDPILKARALALLPPRRQPKPPDPDRQWCGHDERATDENGVEVCPTCTDEADVPVERAVYSRVSWL